MDSFWSETTVAAPKPATSRCPDFVGFLGLCFEKGNESVGLHPVLTTASKDFDDASMGGASFEVRKVRATSFPSGLYDQLFRDRKFVVVKHPRVKLDEVKQAGTLPAGTLSEIATELQILRHNSLRNHENIIEYFATMYYDAGEAGESVIVPSLVIEYAEFGSLKAYQENGYLTTTEERLNACEDIARGLQALHQLGIIHGDVKTSNVLICKHTSRKFVAKLTDFGFSFTRKDGRPIGYTSLLEAPEMLKDEIEADYLPQLDHYSYGLLLHAVFNGGKYFYDPIPEDQRDTHIPTLKTSGVATALCQLNLLHQLKDQRCIVPPLCKVLGYSLQPSPRRRLKSMLRVVEILRLTRPMVISAVPESTTHELENLTLETERSIQVMREHFQATLRTLVRAYTKYVSEPADHFEAALGAELDKRIDQELAVCLDIDKSKPSYASSKHALEKVLHLLNSYQALLLEPADAGLNSQEPDMRDATSQLSEFIFSAHFMPDFPRIYNNFRKAPFRVRKYTIDSLQHIASYENYADRRAVANLNLAAVYVDGLAGESDIFQAAKLVREAAMLGNAEARSLLKTIFSSLLKSDEVGSNDALAWPDKSAMGKGKITSGKFKTHKAYNTTIKTDKITTPFEDDLNPGVEDVGPEPRQSFTNRRTLVSALNKGHLEAVELLLSEDASLINQKLENHGAALVISSRQGNLEMTKLLLSRGADPHATDDRGATPLHWLIAFDEEDKLSVARNLMESGSDLNAIAQMDTDCLNHLPFVGMRSKGTPLFWAVADGDLAAVEILLDFGAEATTRPPMNPDEVYLSPLELACCLSNSSILERFVENPLVASAIGQAVQLHPSSTVLLQPLFFVTFSTQRWKRLLYHGTNFENETHTTLKLLAKHGADADAVLIGKSDQTFKMSAAVAAAYHQCNADVLRSGLECGFRNGLNTTFGTASSGGSPLFMAISHNDREMFQQLMDGGADIHFLDQYGMTPLHRVAKETDDVFFVEKLLDAGATLEPEDPAMLSPFHAAVACGNLTVARLLFDKGADRDRFVQANSKSKSGNSVSKTVLFDMIYAHTRNSVKRVEFLLSLPDRGSDGFIGYKTGTQELSVMNAVAPVIGENPEGAEVTRLMVLSLLEKYGDPKYLNSAATVYRGSVIATATEIGNHKVVQALLSAGADPNIEDELGRTPLDLLLYRYYYPASTVALQELEDIDDVSLVARTLRYVNQNTSNLLSLLTSYDAKPNVFRIPAWAQDSPGYRSLDWVLDRLREDRSPERQRQKEEVRASGVPKWGDMPIRIPTNPSFMDFVTRKKVVEENTEVSSGDQPTSSGTGA